jgi:zinc transport system substrate-binding protein
MMALLAIAIVIPLAMIWVLYSGGALSSNTQPPESVVGNNSSVQVVASFFPLYDFAGHIAGNRVNMTTLVPPGVEPHDWEPTAQQVEQLRLADLFIYNGAGIDDWASTVETKLNVNASEGIALLSDSQANRDPHNWLDPVLAKRQVELIRNGLITADPQNTDYYIQNAQAYISKLESLDQKIKTELSSCAKTDFIAFHSAFGYFSNRYGLHQHAILSGGPEDEIFPQTLQNVVALAKQYGIHVIYSEELVDPRQAEVIANEIPNGKVLVLSPIEGIHQDEQKAGIGYIEKMEMNLENLKEGLECI